MAGATRQAEKPIQRRTQLERRATSELKIIDAAIHVIGAKGTVRMTLAEVGEAAGYSRGLPAHLFGTKENLLTRVVESFIENQWGCMLPNFEPGRGADGIFESIKRWIDGAIKHPDYVRTIQILLGEASCTASTDMTPELVARIREMDDWVRQRLFNYLVEGKHQGQIREHIDPFLHSVIIANGVRGIIGQWALNTAAFDLKKVAQLYVREMKTLLLNP